MAPEYAVRGKFSIKSDVYSFGVMVLEIVTGRRNNGFEESGNGNAPNLLNYVGTNPFVSMLISPRKEMHVLNSCFFYKRCGGIGTKVEH